jgi:hypothetical protein
MIRNAVIVLLLIFSSVVSAQELNCTVNINSAQVQLSDRGIFRDMKQAIEQFMNQRKWTNDNYKVHEKINCSMLITITKMPSIGSFQASVQVQSARPVFNTSYSSLVFNFADRDWEFEYIESLPLEFNDNSYTTNLTSLLAVYAYLILGIDYDTFSELGGTPYFQRAQQVVQNARQSNRPGWDALGSNRSRYWIVENYNNNQMTDIRKALYSYHRLGLDAYESDPEKTRDTILKGLRDIKKVRDINPNAILVVSFFDAKGRELANIFSEGTLPARREAYDIITYIDPSNRSAYEKMIK